MMIWTCAKKTVEALIRKVDQMIFSLMNRGRERPKMTLENVIKRDI